MQCRGCGVAAGANGGANSRLNWLVRGCGRGIRGLGPAQLGGRPSLLLGGSQDRMSGSVSSSATSAASGVEVAAQGSGNPNRKVIVISGMTGMGKSTLSLNLAKRLDGEIINADALQVYRGLDVGTDKLPISTRESVPHHLFDMMRATEQYSIAQFFDDATRVTEDILSRGKTPIVTGGNPFYLNWFLHGRPTVPQSQPETLEHARSLIRKAQRAMPPIDASMRTADELAVETRAREWDAAVSVLAHMDPDSAQKIPRNNYYRLERALEVVSSTGKPMHVFNDARQKPNYDLRCFFLYPRDRVDHYRRLDRRCEEIIWNGLLAESMGLLTLASQQPEVMHDRTAFKGIGYKQAMDYLMWCQEQAASDPNWYPAWDDFYVFLAEFMAKTRRYCQDQMTWCRKERQKEGLFTWVECSAKARDLRQMEDHMLSLVHGPPFSPASGAGAGVGVGVGAGVEVDMGKGQGKDMMRLSKEEHKRVKGHKPKLTIFNKEETCASILDDVHALVTDSVRKGQS